MRKDEKYSLLNEVDNTSSISDGDASEDVAMRPLSSQKAQKQRSLYWALSYSGILLTVSVFTFFLGWELSPKALSEPQIDTAWGKIQFEARYL